ncbi:hypothetical protein Pint_31098 [Pistacia integerrima]|uniref:Uncharacterized protein n=1 Tax=Pistacia integerrima TaxID=434235 RepID=A0ACC0XNZ2_9ROSI|nr:hypothetical protein Pint_31098 [Pistacia integerrima]
MQFVWFSCSEYWMMNSSVAFHWTLDVDFH